MSVARERSQAERDADAKRKREARARRKMALIHRDGATCRLCGLAIDPLDLDNIEVDHRVARAIGGDDGPDNLQVAHKDCNRAKSARREVSLHRQLDGAVLALETVVKAIAQNSYLGIRLAHAVAAEALAALADGTMWRPRTSAPDASNPDADADSGRVQGTSERPNSDVGARARGDEIPFSSREDSETSKTSSGDLKTIPRADTTSVADASSGRPEAESGVHIAGPHRARNRTGDGCFGDAISAWEAGISSVTKKPCLAPMGGSAELAKLVAALLKFCPDVAKRETFAREQAVLFAQTYKGKLSAHSFVDFLNSPDRPVAANGPDPSSAEAAARRRRNEEKSLEDELRARGFAKPEGTHG